MFYVQWTAKGHIREKHKVFLPQVNILIHYWIHIQQLKIGQVWGKSSWMSREGRNWAGRSPVIEQAQHAKLYKELRTEDGDILRRILKIVYYIDERTRKRELRQKKRNRPSRSRLLRQAMVAKVQFPLHPGNPVGTERWNTPHKVFVTNKQKNMRWIKWIRSKKSNIT